MCLRIIILVVTYTVSVAGKDYQSTTQSTLLPDSQDSTTNVSPQESAATTVVPTTALNLSVTKTSSGIDSTYNGEAEDLFSYFANSFNKLLNGDEPTGVESQQTTKDNCNATVGLNDVSGNIPSNVYTYFNNDVSVQGLINSLFQPSIVQSLQSQCHRGNWCLSEDVHKSILETSDAFYLNGPFCSESMWVSLENLMTLRSDCDEKLLLYLVSSIRLLCQMEVKAKNDLGLTRECYARTLEALYVTYSDLAHPLGSLKAQLLVQECNDFQTQMAATYISAKNACTSSLVQLLENFDAWNGMPAKASDIVKNCNNTSPAQNVLTETVSTPEPLGSLTTPLDITLDDQDDLTEQEYIDMLKVMEEEIEEALDEAKTVASPTQTSYRNPSNFENQNINNENLAQSAEDRTIVLLLLSMTVVLIIGLMGVAFVGFQRYRRSRYSVLRRGYSQLSEEESKILRHEYN